MDTEKEPNMRVAQLGIFFDGTGNNQDIDIPKNCETNVAKLSRLYATEPYTNADGDDVVYVNKKYVRGVGSVAGARLLGGVTGVGARQRLVDAFQFVREELSREQARDCERRYIDVVGFSRGASMARHFANMLKNIPVTRVDDNSVIEGIELRFLGVFDTVASFGIPGNNFDLGFDFAVDESFVKCCVHFTAEHERRDLFDLQSIRSAPDAELPDGFVEQSYPGAHSDVGGGYEYTPFRPAGVYKQRLIDGVLRYIDKDNMDYEDVKYIPSAELVEGGEPGSEFEDLPEQPEKSNELSRIALKDMYDKMLEQGIAMRDMQADERYDSSLRISDEVRAFFDSINGQHLAFLQAIVSKFIHDSRYMTGDDNAEDEREVFYTNPKEIDWAEVGESVLAEDEFEDYDDG